MFDYTRAALNKIKKDLNIVKWIFDYGFHIIMIAYLIFAVIVKNGSIIINSVLLGLTIVTLIYTIVYSRKGETKKEKKKAKRVLKSVKHKLKVGTLIVKGISFVVTFYGMYISTNSTSPISIIFTTLMLIMWILSVMLEVFSFLIEIDIDYIKEGLKYDVTLSEARLGIAKLITSDVAVQLDPKVEKLKKFVDEAREERKENFKGNISKIVSGVKELIVKDKKA